MPAAPTIPPLESDAPLVEENVEPLTRALEHCFEMPEEDAVAVVQILAEAFDGAAEIRDETLDSDARSIFYMLEDHDLLTFRRETYADEDGRTLRAYYWSVKDETLRTMASDAADGAREHGTSPAAVYDDVPKDVWASRAA